LRIERGYILRAIHSSPESSKSYPIIRTLEPAPKIPLGIERFVERGLVRLKGMSDFGVKKSLRQIAGALETFVKAVEAHQDTNT